MEREIKHFVLNKMNECAWLRRVRITAQKMKFSITGFFSKCDQIRSFLRIWLHLLKKSLMENFFFLCSNDPARGFLFQCIVNALVFL